MPRTIRTLLAVSLIFIWSAAAAWAEAPDAAKEDSAKKEKNAEKSEDKSDSKKASAKVNLTVAVLDFSANDPGNPDLGRQLGEAIAADLSGKPGITLVDRQSLRRTIQEQSLNLTGLVESGQATKVGKLVGARLLITGSAFTLGKQMTITAKIIGTETTQVLSVAVKGNADADLGELASKLSEKLLAEISASGSKLVASDTESDTLKKLAQKFAGRKLPTVAVIITEQHHAEPATSLIVTSSVTIRAIDPPVETEMKRALVAAGFEIQDVPQNDLTKFARDWKASDIESWPRSLAKVDLLITGESFSEFGARLGDLTSCSARAEINIIRRSDGKVIQADKATARAADLSENIAAKTALEKSGQELAEHTLEFLDRMIPPAKADGDATAPSKH